MAIENRTPRRLARGSNEEVKAYIGPSGEPIYNLETKTLHMHDGLTPGGSALAKKSETENIANAQLASMPANSFKGRLSSQGSPQDLTTAQAWGLVGSAGKATVAQLQAGTDDTQFITSAKLRAAHGKWLLQKIKLSASTAAIVQSIPSEAEQLFISGRFFGQNPTSLLLQFSSDNGVNYENSYASEYMITDGATVFVGSTSIAGFDLGAYSFNDASWSTPFSAEIQLADAGKRHILLQKSMKWTSSPHLVEVIGWGYPIGARATHLRIFASSGLLLPGTSISIWGA